MLPVVDGLFRAVVAWLGACRFATVLFFVVVFFAAVVEGFDVTPKSLLAPPRSCADRAVTAASVTIVRERTRIVHFMRTLLRYQPESKFLITFRCSNVGA